MAAEGTLKRLSFEVVRSPPKSTSLQRRQQTGLFAATFTLRTVLGCLLNWECPRVVQEARMVRLDLTP